MENVITSSGPLEYFTAISIFYGSFVYFVLIWYIFPRFGMLYQDNFGATLLVGWKKEFHQDFYASPLTGCSPTQGCCLGAAIGPVLVQRTILQLPILLVRDDVMIFKKFSPKKLRKN
jgi:hypothetical protein